MWAEREKESLLNRRKQKKHSYRDFSVKKDPIFKIEFQKLNSRLSIFAIKPYKKVVRIFTVDGCYIWLSSDQTI